VSGLRHLARLAEIGIGFAPGGEAGSARLTLLQRAEAAIAVAGIAASQTKGVLRRSRGRVEGARNRNRRQGNKDLHRRSIQPLVCVDTNSAAGGGQFTFTRVRWDRVEPDQYR